MLLRRFNQHIKEQNWFAVGLDILVVIVGIFLGMQVNDWNDRRIKQSISNETEQALQIELETLSVELERALKFNEMILKNTDAYLNDEFVLSKNNYGEVFLFTNYGFPSAATPVLDREISSDRLINNNQNLNNQLRQIHHNLGRLSEGKKYTDEFWNDLVIPYMIKKGAMTEFRRFASNTEYNKKTVEVLFNDEEFKELVAVNNSFLQATVGELKKLRDNVDSTFKLVKSAEAIKSK